MTATNTHIYLLRRYIRTIDRSINNHTSTHTLYLIGAASRPTWSEPPTVSFPSFGPVELLLLLSPGCPHLPEIQNIFVIINRPVALYRWLSVGKVVTIRSSVGCKYRHALHAKKTGSRVFYFPLWRLVRPSEDGERAERLTNTLFGAKDGGQHHQERTSASTSLRRMIRRCA